MEDRKVLAALLASALVGGILGAASSVVVVATHSADAGVGGDNAALQAELSALRVALIQAVSRCEELAERDRSTLAERQRPERIPAAGAFSAETLFAGLDERLARLEAILERSASPGSKSPLPETRGAPFFPSSEEVESRAFRDRHSFWSATRLIEEYGLPARIDVGTNGSTVWTYETSDGRRVFFHIYVDGVYMVSRVG